MRTAAVSCYVDGLANRDWKLRGHNVLSCHLIADTLAELHEMAGAIGMKPVVPGSAEGKFTALRPDSGTPSGSAEPRCRGARPPGLRREAP